MKKAKEVDVNWIKMVGTVHEKMEGFSASEIVEFIHEKMETKMEALRKSGIEPSESAFKELVSQDKELEMFVMYIGFCSLYFEWCMKQFGVAREELHKMFELEGIEAVQNRFLQKLHSNSEES